MASLQSVYGGSQINYGAGMTNPFSIRGQDFTPKAVALLVLFWAAVLYLLKKYGFRFNFGVAGGR